MRLTGHRISATGSDSSQLVDWEPVRRLEEGIIQFERLFDCVLTIHIMRLVLQSSM